MGGGKELFMSHIMINYIIMSGGNFKIRAHFEKRISLHSFCYIFIFHSLFANIFFFLLKTKFICQRD